MNKESGCDFFGVSSVSGCVVGTGVQESSKRGTLQFGVLQCAGSNTEQAVKNEMCGVDSFRINSEMKCARLQRQQSHLFFGHFDPQQGYRFVASQEGIVGLMHHRNFLTEQFGLFEKPLTCDCSRKD